MARGDRVVMHFLAPLAGGALKTRGLSGEDGTIISTGGEYVVACQPQAAALHEALRGTGEAWLVNCPACKATKIFQEADKVQPQPQVKALTDEDVQACAGCG